MSAQREPCHYLDYPETLPHLQAAIQGLPKEVTRAIQEVDLTPYERGEGFAEVIFKNGHRVMRTDNAALFISMCLLVYDLPKK